MKSKNLSKIIKILKSKGFKNIELNPIIETKYIRNQKLKKYLFTFRDEKSNKTYALRPDLSLMSLIQFSKSKINKKTKISYAGESYRKNKTINSQIGWEIYNSKNQSDEYEVIKNSIDVYKKITEKRGCLRINNLELLSSIVNQLEIPSRWKTRVLNEIYNKRYFYEVLKRLETNVDEAKIEVDKKLYNKMKNLNPNTLIGNRTIKDIITRFETKVYKQPRPLDGKRSVKIIKNFLKLKCPIEKAPKLLSEFFKKNELNIKISNNYFPIRKNNVGNLRIEFNSSEIPDVEIYSGLYFSITNQNFSKMISGGVFNKLSSSLELRQINAVGAAINLS